MKCAAPLLKTRDPSFSLWSQVVHDASQRVVRRSCVGRVDGGGTLLVVRHHRGAQQQRDECGRGLP